MSHLGGYVRFKHTKRTVIVTIGGICANLSRMISSVKSEPQAAFKIAEQGCSQFALLQ